MSTLKQSAVWVTALRRRVAADAFLNTRLRIIGYLTLFAALIALGLSISLREALEAISFASLAFHVQHPLLTIGKLGRVIFDNFDALIALLIAASAFGVVVSEIALAPMRHIFDMQKRFISALAHELRTPLSILRMNNEIMRHEVSHSTKMSTFIDENIIDIDRIYEMLNNLLIFERLTTATSLQYDEVRLPHIVEKVITTCTELAEQKYITISISNDTVPSVRGNATSIEQVIFNIVKNAIIYTPARGSVTISYAERGEFVTVAIMDTGVGIPEKDLHHIFEPFYRIDTKVKIAGTGIGLAIVHQIMRLHNGSVEVASVEGKGATFTLLFPVYQKQ